MVGKIETIRRVIHKVLDDFDEAKNEIHYSEYIGKGKLVMAFNSYILPEICLKLLKVLPDKGILDENGIANQIIDYHRKVGTMYQEPWPPRKIKFYEKLEEYIEEDEDILGVIYEGLTFRFEVMAHDIIKDIDHGYLIHIMNNWEGLEDIMEAGILTTTTAEKTFLCAIFWYPIIGMIKARSTYFCEKISEDEILKIINYVLKPMKEIILERIEYKKRPPKEEEFEEEEENEEF